MRRWFNVRLIRVAERIMRFIAASDIHADSTRKMAKDAAFDIGTVRLCIAPRDIR